jgi:ribonuclease P protein component
MLARKQKLDPAILFSRPRKTVSSSHLSLTYAPAANGRFAVTVSAKVARTAVLRHRIKRALFAEIASVRPASYDMVVSVRAVPAREPTTIVRAELRALLDRVQSL